jgi:hypothetical protein
MLAISFVLFGISFSPLKCLHFGFGGMHLNYSYPIWDIFQQQPTMYEHEGYMVGLLLHVQFQVFFKHIFK